MQNYVIKDYQPGFEAEQSRIGIEVARHWTWPYAYDLPGLLRLHARPDFDPETRHYLFLGEQMVGYMFSTLRPQREDGLLSADLDFPRLLPGHAAAAGLLLEKAFAALRAKGVRRVLARVTTMCPGDVRLAEDYGFSIRDWGYKVYYSYQMAAGRLKETSEAAQEIEVDKELQDYARLAIRWYRRPQEWCRQHLQDWHAAGIITHLGVRRRGRLVAACLAAPNEIRTSTAALYYIFSADESSLKALLAQAVASCIHFGADNLIADLVNEHRSFEPVYRELGFQKVADWARCEKILAGEDPGQKAASP